MQIPLPQFPLEIVKSKMLMTMMLILEGENDDHPVSTTFSRYWGEYKTLIIPCPTELSECDKT